jgi:hypothetical protein
MSPLLPSVRKVSASSAWRFASTTGTASIKKHALEMKINGEDASYYLDVPAPQPPDEGEWECIGTAVGVEAPGVRGIPVIWTWRTPSGQGNQSTIDRHELASNVAAIASHVRDVLHLGNSLMEFVKTWVIPLRDAPKHPQTGDVAEDRLWASLFSTTCSASRCSR